MTIDLANLLNADAILLTFTVIGFGMLVGRLQVFGSPIGSVTGVLLVGLAFGHAGFVAAPGLSSIGFALFIFAVGVQAGPRFFQVLMADGRRYALLALTAAVFGGGLAIVVGQLFGLDQGMSAGLLAGALTSTPTLVGAQDAIGGGLVALPPDVDPQTVLDRINVAYAITYIFGTVGILLAVRYVPRFAGIDLKRAAAELASREGLGEDDGPAASADQPLVRAYRMNDEVVGEGITLKQLLADAETGFTVLRIRRGEAVLEPTSDFELQPGDVMSGIGPLRGMCEAQQRLGEEVLDPDLLNFKVISREIVVTQEQATGKTLGGLDLTRQHGCFVDHFVRSGFALPFSDATVLARGDRLGVSGEERRLRRLAQQIGYIERDAEDSDSLTLAFGIAAGLAIGALLIQLGEFEIGLGAAGGILLMGVLVGFLRSLHPTFGLMPPAARAVLMDLGLMLFMAGVGLGAGGSIVAALGDVGLRLFLAGVIVTLLPVAVLYLVGARLLKLNPVLLLGAICGAMTSTPALSVVTAAAGNAVPALGYAGTYTFANVFLTFAGTLVAGF